MQTGTERETGEREDSYRNNVRISWLTCQWAPAVSSVWIWGQMSRVKVILVKSVWYLKGADLIFDWSDTGHGWPDTDLETTVTMHLCVRILSMCEWQPHTALSDSIQHSQLSAGRHEQIRTEVGEKTLPERRSLVNDTRWRYSTKHGQRSKFELSGVSPSWGISGWTSHIRVLLPPHTVWLPLRACFAPWSLSGIHQPSDSISAQTQRQKNSFESEIFKMVSERKNGCFSPHTPCGPPAVELQEPWMRS